MARSPCRYRTCAGAPTVLRSPATMRRKSVSPRLLRPRGHGPCRHHRGHKGDDVRDLMVVAVEQRFGQVNRLPATIEWLSDNGSCYTATETRKFARDIGLLPLTTPVESPQSNGMAEAFVRTFKRDYVAVNPKPDAATVLKSLPVWFKHYNELHPTARSGIVPRASSSPTDQPKRASGPCPVFKGLQQVLIAQSLAQRRCRPFRVAPRRSNPPNPASAAAASRACRRVGKLLRPCRRPCATAPSRTSRSDSPSARCTSP